MAEKVISTPNINRSNSALKYNTNIFLSFPIVGIFLMYILGKKNGELVFKEITYSSVTSLWRQLLKEATDSSITSQWKQSHPKSTATALITQEQAEESRAKLNIKV